MLEALKEALYMAAKKRYPNLTPEQFGDIGRNIIARLPHSKASMSIQEFSVQFEQELKARYE